MLALSAKDLPTRISRIVKLSRSVPLALYKNCQIVKVRPSSSLLMVFVVGNDIAKTLPQGWKSIIPFLK